MKATTPCPPCGGRDCNQGRKCPARQACELPIDFAGPEPRDGWDIGRAWARWVIACVMALCFFFTVGAGVGHLFSR